MLTALVICLLLWVHAQGAIVSAVQVLASLAPGEADAEDRLVRAYPSATIMTAVVSVATALLLIQAMPRVLALPGTHRLIALNQKLTAEVAQRTQVESRLRRLSEELEQRVAERTIDLLATNQSLRESELRYRTLVEHAPEAIVVLDLSTGRFTDANPNADDLVMRGVPLLRKPYTPSVLCRRVREVLDASAPS